MKKSLICYLINRIGSCHSKAFHTYGQGRENRAQKQKAYYLLVLGIFNSLLNLDLM